jgi:VWFA-related protein
MTHVRSAGPQACRHREYVAQTFRSAKRPVRRPEGLRYIGPLVVMAMALLSLVGMSAQDAGVRVTLTSPPPDMYVSGPIPLRATIQPASRARDVARVLFYADGRLVCTAADPRKAECIWDAGAEVREHVIRVVAELTAGGRVVTSTRTKGLDQTEHVRVEVVQITAVVTDRGRFVQGLTQPAFRILEDGVPQTLTHFSAEGSPLEIVVAIDVSESMTPAMPQLKNAVKKFLAAMGANDQVTLVAFNDNLFTLTRRETSAVQRQRAVDRLAPWGGTALYDVIVRGLQQLSSQAGRRVLVVFSDGDDKTSHATIDTVEAAVRASDATLFMVALGRGAREERLKSSIERLVDLSGGRALFVERSDRLQEPFAEILEELSNQYLLGYQSTNAKQDGTWREVKVEVPGTRYSVRARAGYKAGGGSD